MNQLSLSFSDCDAPDKFNHLDLSKYNGEITAYNPATGQHRTFRIKTVKGKESPLFGKRILSLLSGPDNESDYVGFAFVGDDGTVRVWRKHEGTQYEKLGEFLNRSEHHAEKNGVQFKMSVVCRVCNRKLTDPISIDLGIGPICRGE